MDIRFIKKNSEKNSPDNIMTVIKDIMMKSDMDIIQNFDPTVTYTKGDKVYMKYKNKHRVFECIVFSTTGEFDISKWKPYLKKDEQNISVNQLDTFEEVITVERRGLFDHKIKLDDFKYKNTTVAAFNSVTPRLRYGIDFIFTTDGVVKFLKPFNIGERIILEIRRLNGNLFNNMFKEVYVEETYTPLKKTRFIPIQYQGYTSSSKLEIFDKDSKLLEEGIDYTLDRSFIILKKAINAGDRMSVTMWNKVMITITSDEYLIDEEGNVYKLGVNDLAQLKLEYVSGHNVLSKGYIDLISDDGTPYRCTVNTKRQLILTPMEPDILIAANGLKYKVSINENGELYAKEVENDYYKNIYLISTDASIYELLAEDGTISASKLNMVGIIDALNYKNIVSDDNKLYQITIVDGEIILNKVERPYSEENPVQYINLISESGISFMFFATNDGHLAVRSSYIIDDSSNVILGDDGGLYLLGMTNDGEFFTQELRAAPLVAEHKIITDEFSNEYEIHIDEQGSMYLTPNGKLATELINLTLDSDAKDSYICGLSGQYFNSYPYSKSAVLKDIKTGFEYRVYVNNNELNIARVQTELIEKDSIPLVTSNKYYKLIIENGVVKIVDTGVILPEKENVYFNITNQDGSIDYTLSVSEDGQLLIS